ncbi:hypothetical protein [Pseudomonas sp. microsymbiont 2]
MNTDTLLERLTDQLRPERYCHVLLDPLAIRENCDQSLLPHLRQTLGEHALTQVIRADLPQAPKAHPLLVRLSSPGEAPCRTLLELTVQAAMTDAQRRKRQMCGWLFSEVPASVLGPHLTSLCQLPSLTEQSCPVYEPVRLELLVSALSREDQWPLWPIQCWIFATSGGGHVRLTGERAVADATPPLARAMQDDVVLIEGVLAALRAVGRLSPSQQLLPTSIIVAAQAAEHLRAARTLGLHAQDDLISFVLHHLCLHPRLHAHGAVKNMIGTAIQEQRPLSQLFARYTDSHWHQITSSLSRPEGHP